jgi:hypothetical protein
MLRRALSVAPSGVLIYRASHMCLCAAALNEALPSGEASVPPRFVACARRLACSTGASLVVRPQWIARFAHRPHRPSPASPIAHRPSPIAHRPGPFVRIARPTPSLAGPSPRGRPALFCYHWESAASISRPPPVGAGATYHPCRRNAFGGLSSRSWRGEFHALPGPGFPARGY